MWGPTSVPKSEALLRAGMRVVAFEPNPQVLPELRSRCGHSSNWTLVPAALGSGPAIATLHVRRFHGLASLDPDWQGGSVSSPVTTRYHVPVVTLDAAVASFGNPFYCKIDVEGWELEVLKGLTKPIPLVSFEFHLFDKDIVTTSECLARLLDLGVGESKPHPRRRHCFSLSRMGRAGPICAVLPGRLETNPARRPARPIRRYSREDAVCCPG